MTIAFVNHVMRQTLPSKNLSKMQFVHKIGIAGSSANIPRVFMAFLQFFVFTIILAMAPAPSVSANSARTEEV
jgi:hypothetical protein